MEQKSFKSHSTTSTIARASRIQRSFTLAIVVGLVLVPPAAASADGIDIVWLITRVGGGRVHPAVGIAIVGCLMAVNYLLNLVVLGIPASRSLQIKLRTLTKDLAVFTILAQVADRASAVAGFLLGSFIIDLTDLRGEQGVIASLFAGIFLDFIFSGLAVGLLALWYLRLRWGVSRRRAVAIAPLTAVIANPAWAMMIQFLLSRPG